MVSAVASAQTKSWDYQSGGRWEQVQQLTTAPAAPASDPTLDRVEQLISAGRNSQARTLALKWFKTHRDHPLVDRCLFLIAQAEDRVGDPIRAFYYLDQLLDEHPETRLYAAAMQKQYNIADAYLRGRKRKLLGFPILTAEDEAIEMMYRVQQRSPQSPIAERSLLRTADYYFGDRQYDLAEDAYGAFIRQFGRSPSVPAARLKQAYSAYAQFHGPLFEVTPLIDARERLAMVVAEYPELARRENIPAMLEQIDAVMARKLFLRGDFYRRTHEPQAAAYSYRYLLKAYPNSADAPKAQARLMKLPLWARELPEPKVQQDAAALRSPQEPMMPKMGRRS
ncbi:MAG TPA: outer membrane protein assembly factor BamD [Tepidisphaeraceae bacterium]